MQHKVFYSQKFSNKQSAKVVYRFDRLRTVYIARDKQAI